MMFVEQSTEVEEDDADPDTQENILKRALNHFKDSGFTYGQTVPARWFFEALDILEPSKANSFEQSRKCQLQWMARFEPFRKLVGKELRMYLRTNNAKGYLIVMPSEQVAIAKKDRDDDIAKSFLKADFWMSHVNDDDFSDQQRKAMSDALVHNSQLRQMFRKQKRGFN